MINIVRFEKEINNLKSCKSKQGAMPNLMNRRKKKNKVLDIVVQDKSDSDSSCSYDFSSKLNCKYNVFPEELVKNKNVLPKDDKEDCKSIRFEPI